MNTLRTFSVTLPADVKLAIDQLSEKDGVSADEVIGRAIKQHVFLRKFRSLRERLSAQAKDRGIVTDQDVFDRIS